MIKKSDGKCGSWNRRLISDFFSVKGEAAKLVSWKYNDCDSFKLLPATKKLVFF